MRHLASILAATILLALSACGITPVPEPPNLAPPDASLIDFETGTSVPGFMGRPGAVAPGADLWVVNLDSTDPPVVIEVLDDGSFDAVGVVAAFPGQQLRLQARMDGLRSDPIDLLVGGGEIVRPTAGCLLVDPPFEVELTAGATTSVRIDNTCGAEARIEMIRLRAPSTVIAAETAAPLVVPDGGTATVEISFGSDVSGLSEEIVILDVTAPETDRRPITAYGVAP